MAMYGKTRINAAGLSTFEPEPCCLGYIHWYVNHLVADVEFFTDDLKMAKKGSRAGFAEKPKIRRNWP